MKIVNDTLRRYTKRLEDLDYADDLCLLSHIFIDMKHKLNALNEKPPMLFKDIP